MQQATDLSSSATFPVLQSNVIHNFDILREVLTYLPDTKDWG
jgi:hypothetical protein